MKISIKIKYLFWFCTLALIGLSGCSIVKHQYGHVNGEVSNLKNYHDVLSQVGAPDSIGYTENGFVFLYQSVQIIEPQLGISLPGIDWLKFSYGRAEAYYKVHWYSFSNDDKLLAVGKKEWTNELGGGSAIGIIIVVTESVDISRFKEVSAQLLWGKNLLLPQLMDEYSNQEIISGKRVDNMGQTF